VINFRRLFVIVTALLLLPLIAMQFSDEVNWNLVDFVVAGFLLAGIGILYELAARKTSNIEYRAAVGLALAGGLLLIWINLAVGIIGTEDNPANLMYIGVLFVGIIGAFLIRFESRGMVRVLFATALAQAVTVVIALVTGMHETPYSSIGEILILNVFFIALFIGSAYLFRRAALNYSPD